MVLKEEQCTYNVIRGTEVRSRDNCRRKGISITCSE